MSRKMGNKIFKERLKTALHLILPTIVLFTISINYFLPNASFYFFLGIGCFLGGLVLSVKLEWKGMKDDWKGIKNDWKHNLLFKKTVYYIAVFYVVFISSAILLFLLISRR